MVPQPGLLPVVISVKVDPAMEYKNGFRKPRGDFPAPTSWSFMREMILAKMGLEQLVPATILA